MTPTARCCAREPRLPHRGRRAECRRALADGAGPRAPPGRSSRSATAGTSPSGIPAARRGPPPPVGWADVSHLRKLELQAEAEALDAAGTALASATAVRADGAWWCRLTATRALVIGGTADVARQRSTSPATSPRSRSPGPLAREVFARFCALDLRPHGHPGAGAAPGLDRPPARDPHPRGRGPLPVPVRLGHRRVRVDDRRRRRPSTSAAARRRRRAGGSSMLDIFRKRRMWRRQAELQELLRRRDHRRRLARPGHRVLPARARDQGRRDAGEALHRLGRRGAQHDDPALQLQDARRAPASTTPASSSTRGSRRSSTSTCCSPSAAT